MKFNIHAGHNPDGKVACGAVGLIKESTEARKVKDKVIQYLRKEGHTAYDCTCNNGTSKEDVLREIIEKCNSRKVDMDVSIHFNSGAKDKKGNGETTGVEVFVYKETSKCFAEAVRVGKKIKELGFKNRGIKVNASLYVLKHTKSPAMLIEVCFVDDKDDVELYQKNVDKISKAIAEALINKKIEDKPKSNNTVNTNKSKNNSFKVKVKVKELNYRSGAGTEYKVKGSIKDKGTYTIIKTAKSKDGGNWGQLKSKAGWINISSKYVDRL